MPGSGSQGAVRTPGEGVLVSAVSASIAEPAAEAAQRERLDRFRGFVLEHQDAAIRIAWRLVGGDYAAAEDIAQEAFLRAYTGLPRFREEASLPTWFYRILVREVQRHRRWQSARRIWSTRSLSEVELPDSPCPAADVALQNRLIAALERLTRRQREAVVLVHLEMLTVNETAELLGTSPGTVKTHLHRALHALRRDLADLRAPEAAKAGDAP